MKAVRYYQYGGPEVLRIEESDKPSVDDTQVLVRVRAAALNPYDWHFMRGKPKLMRMQAGLTKPKYNGFGVDFAGEIETVGKQVIGIKPGDEVYGEIQGAFAEYVCGTEKGVARKPSNLTFAEAAAVPMGAMTAIQALRDSGQLQTDQKVLINGASGGVGIYAVSIAKSMGADVTGVCSTKNIEMVRSLGADRVIDYTSDDFTQSGTHYDLIVDCVGSRTLSECRRVLLPGGRYVMVGADRDPSGGYLRRMLKMALMSAFGDKKMLPMLAKRNQDDLAAIRGLCEAGMVRPVIDREFPLSEVAEAIRYLEQGHVAGKIVLTI